ncbi:MAG: hypothetical protein IKM24_05870 [Clostridia bacterium]|nr:hypothetical protein [Clostridia bacterium]
MTAEKANKKTKRPILRKKSITKKIFSRISLILLFALVLPILAYDQLPEPVYLLLPGVRMWIASDEIMEFYGSSEEFTLAVNAVETGYDAKVEVYNADNRLIYSTNYAPEMTENIVFPLKNAPVINDKYKPITNV